MHAHLYARNEHNTVSGKVFHTVSRSILELCQRYSYLCEKHSDFSKSMHLFHKTHQEYICSETEKVIRIRTPKMQSCNIEDGSGLSKRNLCKLFEWHFRIFLT